jgi:transposase
VTFKPPECCRRALKSHIIWLDKQIATLDDGLNTRLRNSDAWKAKDDLLRGIPGVGPVTSVTCLGYLDMS